MSKHNIYQALTLFTCLVIIAVIITGFLNIMLIIVLFSHPLIIGSFLLFYLISFLDSLTSLFSPNRKKYRLMIVTHSITIVFIAASILALYFDYSAELKEKELIRYPHTITETTSITY